MTGAFANGPVPTDRIHIRTGQDDMYMKHVLPHQLRESVERGGPLLVPAGCIETRGPHMAIGHDTIIVEDLRAGGRAPGRGHLSTL